uniref:Uncharacterized protein n=1 Tax=Rhinolophus ferrumequinum TaxID=59479 RepID=A0A671DJH5_RHIFE
LSSLPSFTPYREVPGPPSVPWALKGWVQVWGSRLGRAPEPGQLLPALHFCKANPYTRILTPGALYYWSSYLGLLFYINKEMSENCWRC